MERKGGHAACTVGEATYYAKWLDTAVEHVAVQDCPARPGAEKDTYTAHLSAWFDGNGGDGKAALSKRDVKTLAGVAWAVERGLLAGRSGGVLDPTGTATRAEVAVILQRLREGQTP